MSPLSQKYAEAVLRGAQDKESGIDYVYGVYLHKDGLMFGNKHFDEDDVDNIIIGGTIRRYMLIFTSWFSREFPTISSIRRRVQEYAAGNEHVQIQSFARSIIKQQGIEVETHNRAVDVDYT